VLVTQDTKLHVDGIEMVNGRMMKSEKSKDFMSSNLKFVPQKEYPF